MNYKFLDGELYGTLGIVKPVPYDFTQDEQDTLMKIGEEMSRYLRANTAKGNVMKHVSCYER